MNNGPIEYVNPTSGAFDRMKTILFSPFDIGKWFVLGFTAWLATLLEGGCSGTGGGGGDDFGNTQGGDFDFEQVKEGVGTFIRENLDWILPVGIAGILVIAVISIALLWVSSRGKFMFLDNVVHDRALVKQPWSEFRVQANSLFWWRLVFSIVGLVIFLVAIGVPAYLLITTFDENNVQPGWVAGLVGAGLGLLLIGILIAYIGMLLDDFVVPIMYKHSLSTTAAWGRLLTLHGDRPFSFIGYGLWRVLLSIASGIIVLAVAIATCCIAALVMAIPYIGAVFLLPLTVFFRSLGLEFLRQFGDDYDMWADAQAPPQFPGPTPTIQ